MRTGLDGTGQHFTPPRKKRKIKDKKERDGGQWAVRVNDHSPKLNSEKSTARRTLK